MDDIEKSRYGRYEDNAKNRRLHRVGQEYGSKKQENEPSKSNKPTLDEIRKEINELGNILRGRIKDGRHTEDVEKRISEMLQQTTDLTLKNTLENFEKFTKLDTFANIISRLVNDEIKRRKTEEKEKAVLKESTEEENKAQSEEPETYTRLKFDDVPNSGKINLKKYLSDKVRKGVDEKWSNIRNIPTENLKKMEKGLVNDLNKNFEAIKKSQRAELLYSIIKVKGELSKRSKETKSEPAKETKKEVPKQKNLYDALKTEWVRIVNTVKPVDVNPESVKSIAEAVLHFLPDFQLVAIEGATKESNHYLVQSKSDPTNAVSIYPYMYTPKYIAISVIQAIRNGYDKSEHFTDENRRLAKVVQEDIEGLINVSKEDEFRTKKFLAENKANLSQVAAKLHAKVGKPMDFLDANEMRGNINYPEGELYKNNCQSCVVANELRRRGLNVTALAKTSDAQERLSKDLSLAWIDPMTGYKAEKTVIFPMPNNENPAMKGLKFKRGAKKTIEGYRKNIHEFAKEVGRYEFAFAWKVGKNKAGHIITCERHADGSLTFYDPQNGKMDSLDRILPYVDTSYWNAVRMLRVDNLLLNPENIEEIVTKYDGI